jgi:hypothetical protein
MCPTTAIPDEFATALTEDAAFPKRQGKPEEYAKLALAIVDNRDRRQPDAQRAVPSPGGRPALAPK